MALETLAHVKARLGITTSADDDLLDLLRDSADAFVASYVGREFEAGTFTEYFARDAATVVVRNFPIASVTSVKVDRLGGFAAETVLSTAAYVVDHRRGRIQCRYGPFVGLAPNPIRTLIEVQVVYTTSGAVPADVLEAYALIVGHWYRHVKTQIAAGHQNVTQQTFGDATAIFSKDQIAGLPIPADALRLLAAYRTPVI